jgi:hypothetical protein
MTSDYFTTKIACFINAFRYQGRAGVLWRKVITTPIVTVGLTPMRYFAVVAHQRSGSTFLGSVLNAHPQIHICGELFLDKKYRKKNYFYHYWLGKMAADKVNITISRQPELIHDYLDSVMGQVPDSCEIGIDVKYNQLRMLPKLLQVFDELDFKIIHLIRKNTLKTHVSYLLNIKKKELGRKAHGSQKVPVAKITLPTDETLVDRLETKRDEIDYYRRTLRSRFEYLELYYEDFFGSGTQESRTIAQEVLDQVFHFLSIPAYGNENLTSELKKTNPAQLSKLIENYEEVKTLLSATQFADLLE